MALLGYQTKEGFKFQCGGSLINSRYILTAAHCVTGISDTLVSVRLGEHDLSSEVDCVPYSDVKKCAPPVQNIDMESSIPHPEYSSSGFANDIALIRLSQEAVLNDAVQPICLPVTDESLQDDLARAIISGWGFTEKGNTSDVLLQAIVPIVQNEVCQQLYKRSTTISDKQLCAGGESGIDTCKGDSGGPLFSVDFGHTECSRRIQYGIISAGVEQCGGKYPGIFIRVASYTKWISDQLKD